MSTEGFRGEIGAESSSNETVVSVGLGDLSPDGSEFGVSLGGLGLIDVTNFLSQIKSCITSLVHILHLQKSLVLVLSSLTSFESSENCFLVQSRIKGVSAKVVPHWLGFLVDFGGFLFVISFFSHFLYK